MSTRVTPTRGVMWFFGVAIAYGAGPIGYLLHLICAVSAASYGTIRYDERRRRRRGGGSIASPRTFDDPERID